jgi:hypothetical protein
MKVVGKRGRKKLVFCECGNVGTIRKWGHELVCERCDRIEREIMSNRGGHLDYSFINRTWEQKQQEEEETW